MRKFRNGRSNRLIVDLSIDEAREVYGVLAKQWLQSKWLEGFVHRLREWLQEHDERR